MTLTDIMPTLRMSIPDPIDLAAWPPDTSTTTDDVVVESLSMRRVADLLGTPCEWTTNAPSRSGCATVVMCRVSAVVHDGDEPIILVDCPAGRFDAAWSHARLIARISVAHKGMFRLLGDGSSSDGLLHRPSATCNEESVSLPEDLMVGDLLVVPCVPAGSTPARLRAQAAPPAHVTPV